MDVLRVLVSADGGWGYAGVRMRCVRVWMRMSGKRKKEKKTYLRDCQGCAGRGTGMRMTALALDADVLRAGADEYKGKRRRKKKSLLCWCGWWTRGLADVLRVDADGGCGWWWTRMVVDTALAVNADVLHADADEYKGKKIGRAHV